MTTTPEQRYNRFISNVTALIKHYDERTSVMPHHSAAVESITYPLEHVIYSLSDIDLARARNLTVAAEIINSHRLYVVGLRTLLDVMKLHRPVPLSPGKLLCDECSISPVIARAFPCDTVLTILRENDL